MTKWKIQRDRGGKCIRTRDRVENCFFASLQAYIQYINVQSFSIHMQKIICIYIYMCKVSTCRRPIHLDQVKFSVIIHLFHRRYCENSRKRLYTLRMASLPVSRFSATAVNFPLAHICMLHGGCFKNSDAAQQTSGKYRTCRLHFCAKPSNLIGKHKSALSCCLTNRKDLQVASG